MLGQLALGLDILHWESWTVPMVGMASAGLMLIMARTFLRQPKQPSPPPARDSAARVPSENGSTIERRASLRRGGKTVKVLISDASATAEPYTGWVCDRSMGGLCLAVARAEEVGMILSVRTVDAEATTPWIQVEVKRCRAHDGRWELGCQFVRMPRYSELLLFG